MRNEDFDEFARLLDDAYDLIGVGANKIISGGAKSMFFAAMAPYPLDVVRAALNAHCLHKERGRFTPKPADLIEQIEGMTGGDGRPGADEAWAIAITSRDEAETVVWTAEAAEAFSICSPVLQLGEKVGARVAFKDAYNRLVNAARIAGKPAAWNVSLGWDVGRREAAIEKATVAGLLPAPTAHALLPHHIGKDGKAITEMCPEGLTRLKAEMAKMKDAWTAAAERRAAELEAQREAEAKRKQEIAAKVAAYGKNTAE
jgi:hypothetical protein